MEHTGPSSVLWLLCYFRRFKGSKHPRVKLCMQLSGDAAPFLGCVPPWASWATHITGPGADASLSAATLPPKNSFQGDPGKNKCKGKQGEKAI